MLVKTTKALAKLEHQFRTVVQLSVSDLTVVALNTGRFEDEFRLYYHELQLRKALEIDPHTDVSYARFKMREYAMRIIKQYEIDEIRESHTPAIFRNDYKINHDKIIRDNTLAERRKKANKDAIRRLLNRST